MQLMKKMAPFLLLLCLYGSCKNASDGRKLGEVVKIADGDTFTLLYPGNVQVKVRLYGIDCPERAQAFGVAARKALGNLLEGHRVYLNEQNRDRYGRVVAIAFRDDSRNINEALLQQGYAWHYRAYDNNPAWTTMEEQARAARIGLWQDARPTPPWEFRKNKREKSKKN